MEERILHHLQQLGDDFWRNFWRGVSFFPPLAWIWSAWKMGGASLLEGLWKGIGFGR